MKKINYLIDITLFFSFLIVCITGLIKWRLLMDFLGMTHLYFVLPMGQTRIWHEWSSILLSSISLVSFDFTLEMDYEYYP